MPGVVLGVDGCRRGWVGARVARNELTWVTLPHAGAAVASDADAIGVDIPIGLPESGPRACDRAARRLLSRRGVCVFPAPARAVLTAVLTARLTAGSYEQACAASRAAIGTALPRQSWNLVPKIIEWDALVDPELQRRVVEVHPEVTYAVSTGRPAPAKRSPAGVAARIAAGCRVSPRRWRRDRPRSRWTTR